jgi:hypothetical protein
MAECFAFVEMARPDFAKLAQTSNASAYGVDLGD